jgi:vesicle coat complex subunit
LFVGVSLIFVWNEILKKENQKQNLLLFLKDKFNLKDIKFNSIKKNTSDSMTVRTGASAPIKLKLDKDKSKVIMTCTDANNQFREYEYDIEQMGSDIVVVEPMISEENDTVDKAKNELEQLIYEFVSSLGASITDSDRSKECLYYKEILSEDKKFMKAVQGIYENRHKVLERGYSMLTGTK